MFLVLEPQSGSPLGWKAAVAAGAPAAVARDHVVVLVGEARKQQGQVASPSFDPPLELDLMIALGAIVRVRSFRHRRFLPLGDPDRPSAPSPNSE